MKIMNNLNLPPVVKVRISKGKSGSFLAELPEYGIHTESDSISGLDFMINDLVYAYFDVPEKYWGKIWYRKKELKPKPQVDLKKLLLYQQFIASNVAPMFK
ncbi:hypothetical protein KKB40_00580 [Patescibacteria group bacterium]|nr:hypothetical protein [Patescibacteria group bacterium]